MKLRISLLRLWKQRGTLAARFLYFFFSLPLDPAPHTLSRLESPPGRGKGGGGQGLIRSIKHSISWRERVTSRNPKRRKGFCVLCLHRLRRRRLALSPDRPTDSVGISLVFQRLLSLLLLRERGRSVSASPLLTFFTRHRFLPAFSTHSRKKAKHCSTPNWPPCDEPRGSLSLSNPSFPVTDSLVQMET